MSSPKVYFASNELVAIEQLMCLKLSEGRSNLLAGLTQYALRSWSRAASKSTPTLPRKKIQKWPQIGQNRLFWWRCPIERFQLSLRTLLRGRGGGSWNSRDVINNSSGNLRLCSWWSVQLCVVPNWPICEWVTWEPINPKKNEGKHKNWIKDRCKNTLG